VIAPDGTLLYEIPLCPSPYWTMYQQRTLPDGRVLIESNVDNNLGRDPKTGYYSDTDFIFTVEYKNGVPCKVTIGDCDGNGDTNYTDFRVSHQPIWNGQRFLKRFAEGHVGETVDLQQEVKEIAKETPIQPSWTVLSKSMGFLGETNYGMSRGSHIDLEGKELLTPDSKLFFILDYPKPVADYAHLGTDDPWSQFFVLDPAKWTPPPGFEHYTCQEVQALRHFGMANVLFCDGHVETLGPDPVTVNDKVLGSYLRPDSSLWRFGTH
jgi:prepilin-type processing-associated H-X9-DG protein